MNTSANVKNKKNTLKSSLFWFIVLPFFTKNHSAHNSRVLWKNRGLKCSEIDNRRIVLNGRQTFRTNRPRTKVHTNVHFTYIHYSHLSNKRGGWNKRGGGAKNAKSLNLEEVINIIFWARIKFHSSKWPWEKSSLAERLT